MTDGKSEQLAKAGRFSIRYGEDVIAYALRLQPQRQASSVAIHVESSGRVLVDAPVGATQTAVAQAVKKRASWIAQHVAEAKARLEHVRQREYTSGESVHYLGRRYRLRVKVDPASASSCRLRGGYLEVSVQRRAIQDVQAVMAAWLRHRAGEVLRERLDTIARRLRWVAVPPPMRLQWMRVQWGSCSPRGRITLHPALVQAPRDCIDYVVLHELCHLASHDHSPKFYRLLDRHMPGWRAVKSRLDGMAEELLRQ
ncbi:metal-dependent hydrolase [Methylibium sp. Pch-M]|uniref:M48 family metallopeptidase n=1 Tax=Methylibium sp. Pch-M TaxID=2082386 RepID=UPI0010100B96|nr:SprT family zinc-dependent metalloprotease [Methylibium sp. Pch-M]QAZ39565.1 metal-dependent hydrolase [Methylibium sp. Pch-M]